jgi:hypothetical protein
VESTNAYDQNSCDNACSDETPSALIGLWRGLDVQTGFQVVKNPINIFFLHPHLHVLFYFVPFLVIFMFVHFVIYLNIYIFQMPHECATNETLF